MKTMRTILAMMLLLVSSVTIDAQPMSYYAMRDNARFLTDRMAYTLGVTSPMLIDDLYRINFDYICGVNDYLDDVALGYRYSDYMAVMHERDRALRTLLGPSLWARVMTFDYFFRPIVFADRGWRFAIYAHDSDRMRFYRSKPRPFHNYRGGHFFAGMRPVGPPPHRPSFHVGDRHNGGKRPADGIRPRPGNKNQGVSVPVKPDKKGESGRFDRPGKGDGERGRSNSNVRSSSRSGADRVDGRRVTPPNRNGESNASRSNGATRVGGGRR